MTRLRGGQISVCCHWGGQCPGKAEPNPQISTFGLRCRGSGREEELKSGTESGLCRSRDGVIPAQWHVRPEVGREQRAYATAGGRMAEMENMDASLGTCCRQTGGRHCIMKADVAIKTFPPPCYFFLKASLNFYTIFKLLFIISYLFLTALGLHCCEGSL